MKKNTKKLLLCAAALAVFCVSGCENVKKAAPFAAAGSYFGTVPCADCSGINLEVILNADFKYSMAVLYQERPGTILKSGTFAWDEAGTKIDLQNVNESGSFQYFLLQENKLVLLSPAGKIEEGVKTKDYTLTKIDSPAAGSGITARHWKLVELNSQPVTLGKGNREAYIEFSLDGRVSGNLSCNFFNGAFTLQKDGRIRFAQLASTQKMCVDMRTETELLRVLQNADSYTLNGSQLILNRARMAPLARFETKYLP